MVILKKHLMSAHKNDLCKECGMLTRLLDWLIRLLTKLKTRSKAGHICKKPEYLVLRSFAVILESIGIFPKGVRVRLQSSHDRAKLFLISSRKPID